MDDRSPAEIRAGYAELASRLRADGLMERRYALFFSKSVLVLLVTAGGWVALGLIGDHWAALGIAAGLGLTSTQIVFFGHDAGHRQLFDRAWANRLVGLCAGNLLTGLSFGWWEPKHNAHHAHPNQVGKDPDVAAGVIAFTSAAAATRRRFGHWALRRQAWTFFPLLTLEGFSLRVASVQSVWARRHDRRGRVEAVLIIANLCAYLTVVFWVLSPLKAALFIAVEQAVFGVYMGSSFAPNHKGMPTLAGDTGIGFIERQVVTARNVRGGRLLTFVLGGLNYQIEHHLFPKMPMANLRRSQPLVLDFCYAYGLTYREDTLIGSYRTALSHLRHIGHGGADPAYHRQRPMPVPAIS